jgi:hypothetical protein
LIFFIHREPESGRLQVLYLQNIALLFLNLIR